MPILIKDAHDFIRMQIKKNRMGFVSPEDIDRAINRAVSDWMSASIVKYKHTGKYAYDHLLVKRKAYAVTVANSGLMDIPADYTEALTIYVELNGVLQEGSIFSWDEFLEAINSYILPPNLSDPAATIYISETGVPKIQFNPVPPTAGVTYAYSFVYMRKPAPAIFKYTVSTTTGAIAYNPTGSVDIDLDDRYFSDILTRSLMYLGVGLGDSNSASTEQIRDANQKNDEQ